MAIFTNYLFEFSCIVISIVFGLYLYVKYVAFNYWSSKNVAHPKPAIPFGSLGPVTKGKRSMGQMIADVYAEYKKNPVIGVYNLTSPALIIAKPDLIRFVLTKEFAHFHDRGVYCNEKIDPLTGHLFALPGAKWKYLRTKFTPTFTASKMKQMFFTVKETSVLLANAVEQNAKKSEVIEVKELMARFTTDVIASVAFGINCNSLENPDAEFRTMGRKIFEPRLVKRILGFLLPSVLQFFKIPIIDETISKFFIRAFREAVEYRTANNIVRKDFLDSVIQLMNKGYVQNDNDKSTVPAKELDDQKITLIQGAAQAFVFWIGGFDTSSSTVTFCLYEMALHLDIQDRLAEEINQVLQEYGGVTYESIKAMPYLHKVVSETLRKYPVIPMLNRVCEDDIELPGTGLRVEKGTGILIPVLGLHTDPDIFPEPEKFDPERFDEENIAKRHPYAYLPFGEGPRNCIGMRFGLLQTKVGIVSLLSKYRFTPSSDLKPIVMDTANFLQVPLHGVSLRIQMR
ncbi:probable cytochrome P450 6a14 isoform X1 [Diprion similis]|uniref:probable cytochrome P450 6a14 isoform X1 n=1 Tax=Diprion similis TaxID=362088 RepID=UPI001EF819BD|nr:probable cytochrome P450 6a14 isoform X1 [Diprion similis]